MCNKWQFWFTSAFSCKGIDILLVVWFSAYKKCFVITFHLSTGVYNVV